MVDVKVDTKEMREVSPWQKPLVSANLLRAAADELDALRAEKNGTEDALAYELRKTVRLTEENERLKRRVEELTKERNDWKSRFFSGGDDD